MDDVIENCQTTFEEDGVNQQTLDDLRKVGLFPFVLLVKVHPFARDYQCHFWQQHKHRFCVERCSDQDINVFE